MEKEARIVTSISEAIDLLESDLRKANKGGDNGLIPGLERGIHLLESLYPKSFNSIGDAFEFGKTVGRQGLNINRSEYFMSLPKG